MQRFLYGSPPPRQFPHRGLDLAQAAHLDLDHA